MFWSALCSSPEKISRRARILVLTCGSSSILSGLGRSGTLEEMERGYIQQVLRDEHGRVQSAARKLGIPRSSLYHKLKQYKMESRLRSAS